MEGLIDYDIIRNETSTSFIVKHRPTGKLYTLLAVPVLDLSSNDHKTLLKRIKLRSNLNHPNILNVYDIIELHDVVYLKQENCKFGTLQNFIEVQLQNQDRQASEALICRILYQIAFSIKTVQHFKDQLSLETVYLDADFNVKLQNFSTDKKLKSCKMSQLGIMAFQLCTLKVYDKANCEAQILQSNYSDGLRSLIISLIKDNTDIFKHLNKILCHPTILLGSSQWRKLNSFVEGSLSKAPSSELSHEDYSGRFRRRELALQVKEQLLKDLERKLTYREKKLQIMERNIKEKMQKADLYLKRCSSLSSTSSKQSVEYDEPSYCEESDMCPTSSKLEVNKIAKPSQFSRTLSERRIRFKVSPLKDRNFARKTLRPPKVVEEPRDKRRSLFLPRNNEESGWNHDTKKQAFELLRMMKEDENIEIKHTIL